MQGSQENHSDSGYTLWRKIMLLTIAPFHLRLLDVSVLVAQGRKGQNGPEPLKMYGLCEYLALSPLDWKLNLQFFTVLTCCLWACSTFLVPLPVDWIEIDSADATDRLFIFPDTVLNSHGYAGALDICCNIWAETFLIIQSLPPSSLARRVRDIGLGDCIHQILSILGSHFSIHQ